MVADITYIQAHRLNYNTVSTFQLLITAQSDLRDIRWRKLFKNMRYSAATMKSAHVIYGKTSGSQ